MISSAWAQDVAAAAGPQGSLVANLVPLVLIIGVFYFLILRPQQKRMREHQSLIDGLRRGDKVVTSGGIVGVITKVEADNSVMVEIAPDVRVKVIKSTITAVNERTEPAKAEAKEEAKPAAVKPASKPAATPVLAAPKPVATAKKPAGKPASTKPAPKKSK